jgi:hypothetical protein
LYNNKYLSERTENMTNVKNWKRGQKVRTRWKGRERRERERKEREG